MVWIVLWLVAIKSIKISDMKSVTLSQPILKCLKGSDSLRDGLSQVLTSKVPQVKR